ncbi:DsrE family protein [bacterium]|nr:DsrE family protein [bacterium]
MKRFSSYLAIAAAVVLIVSLGWLQTNGEQADTVRDGMLMHISKSVDDPHRAMMPLTLALKMTEVHDVQLFLDIDAIFLVTKDGPDLTYEGFEMTSKQLVKALLDKGIHIDACPMCMKSHGVTKDQLVDGVRIASAETFTGFTDGRIVTMDW